MAKSITENDDLLKPDGPVAIVMTQYLRPAEGEGEPIFPPTYPMPTYRGRVHTVRDGEYRVSVELPPFHRENTKGERDDEESQTVAGYNIDEFKDGSNVCEIDSPQSQANRLEPLFKTIRKGQLVPQITIAVGEQHLNLLDAGHRAADAVVRLSSLVARFHRAFEQATKGDHSTLARLAPTSLLFGVWDSRGTQVKLPRIIKAEIRATNVQPLTRSAQFNPAIDYVAAKAVDEDLDKGSGPKNPLGAEGLKHVPAPRAAGGIKVLGDIKRVVRINLAALRDLQALDSDGKPDATLTPQLQRYVLGLALVAATHPVSLNLREGCLLCGVKGKSASWKLVALDGDEKDIDLKESEDFADLAAREFFGSDYDKKDIADGRFESGVANRFLALPSQDRKTLTRSGPVTEDALRRFEETGRDPFKLVSEQIKAVKKNLPKPARNAPPYVSAEAFKQVNEILTSVAETADDSVRSEAEELQKLIAGDSDTRKTVEALGSRIKEFNRRRKAAAAPSSSAESEATTSS